MRDLKGFESEIWSTLSRSEIVEIIESSEQESLEDLQKVKGLLMDAVRWIDGALFEKIQKVNQSLPVIELLREKNFK